LRVKGNVGVPRARFHNRQYSLFCEQLLDSPPLTIGHSTVYGWFGVRVLFEEGVSVRLSWGSGCIGHAKQRRGGESGGKSAGTPDMRIA